MGFKFLCCISSEQNKKRTQIIETSLDFSRCNLYEIPIEEISDPEALQEIDFSYNKLQELNPILMRCKNMRVLNLSDNQLSDIPDQLSTAFQNLREINLSHNRFQDIPTVFKALHLTSLDLSNNPITKILDGSITEIVSLKELRLNTCSLNFLPANIARLTNLECLELRENYLETLPVTIKHLTKLRLLDIGRNNLEELPAEISFLTNLQELMVDENNLYDMSVIGELQNQNLRHLDISSNNLGIFPVELTKCVKLEILYADGNESFEALPESFGNLTNLTKLNLSYVGLRALPNSLGNCQVLEELNVQENFLSSLPASIGFLRHLKILVAYGNRLSSLPNELASCVSLTHLNVANNKLTTLPDNIGYLKQLKSLNIIGNYLMYLPISLGMNQNLEGLWLSSHQEGMRKPNLSKVEYEMVGIVLTSPLLEQNYKPEDQKSMKTGQYKIHFDMNSSVMDEEGSKKTNEDNPVSPKPQNHHQIVRVPTPTQSERKRLEKFAKTINAERKEIAKTFEIKEAKVASTSGVYANTPRQRRSLDPEYVEISSELRPLCKPPPYEKARLYSKMSQLELDNFEKINKSSSNNNFDNYPSNLPLLSNHESVQLNGQ